MSGTRVDTTYTVPTNSNDLKEIIYHQWLEKKKVQTKEEIKAKMLAQKRAAKQAEEEATERKVTVSIVHFIEYIGQNILLSSYFFHD